VDGLFEPPGWRREWLRDVVWWVRSDWRDALLGPTGLRLDEWRRQGRLTVVKRHAYRVVYRAELDQGAVYLKHYLVPGLRAKLRQWLRRGKGRNEGRRARYLNALGVPTITPVALGEQRKGGFLLENYLVTHAISESLSLQEFLEKRLPHWPQHRRPRLRRNLARELALMTARLHDHGFFHLDYHPGNILVRVGDDDRPRLAIVDLDGLRVSHRFWQFWEDLAGLLKIPFEARRLSGPLTWSESRRNLALLNHSFWLGSERTDRFRFLSTYVRARKAAPPSLLDFARGIEQSTRQWAEKHWRRWGRRCQKTNKYFVTASGPRTWSVASRELDGETLRSLLADPDAPFTAEGAVLLKDSRTTTVAETTMTVGGRPTRVIYKRFNKKKWIDPFLTYFRPSRAWQAWQGAQHLASRAIPTPRNLAFVARLRRFPRDLFWYLPHETYLVSVKEESAVTLAEYVLGTFPSLGPVERRTRILGMTLALARLLRTLHERSLSHRDLKAVNILVRPDHSGPGFALSLIDLVGVRLVHPLPRHRRVQNLARLHLSLANVPGRTRTDALRFLRAYLPWGLSSRNDWKGLWRAVESCGEVKRERNRRRGRVLS
jgi:tRNA A-37 threonylcarbamoyl transferase component Bud32